MGRIMKNGISYSASGSSAQLINYVNTTSHLNSTNVQGAIDELNSNLLANGQPFKYGYDSESDKYGYIRKVDGADTFFPFSEGGLPDDAQIVTTLKNDVNPASANYTPTEDCTLLFCAIAGNTNSDTSRVHYWSVSGATIEKQLQRGVGTTSMFAIVQLKATAGEQITFKVTSNAYTAYQYHVGLVVKL